VRLADGSWRSAGAVLLAAGIQATRFCSELAGHAAVEDTAAAFADAHLNTDCPANH